MRWSNNALIKAAAPQGAAEAVCLHQKLLDFFLGFFSSISHGTSQPISRASFSRHLRCGFFFFFGDCRFSLSRRLRLSRPLGSRSEASSTDVAQP